MGITGWIASKVQQWVCEGLVSGMQGSKQQQQNSSGNKNRHTYSLSPVANGHSKDTQSYLVAAFKQLPRHSHPLPSPVSYFARVPGKSATKLLLVCVCVDCCNNRNNNNSCNRQHANEWLERAREARRGREVCCTAVSCI